MLNPIYGGEFLVEKGLVGLQIWNNHPHQIVKVDSHQIALHYFGPFQHLLGKAIQIFGTLWYLKCFIFY